MDAQAPVREKMLLGRGIRRHADNWGSSLPLTKTSPHSRGSSTEEGQCIGSPPL